MACRCRLPRISEGGFGMTRIIGLPRSRRRRYAAVALPLVLLAALILAIGGAASNTELASFEIEGDQVSGIFNGGGGVPPTVTGEDWLDGGPGTGALVCTAS